MLHNVLRIDYTHDASMRCHEYGARVLRRSMAFRDLHRCGPGTDSLWLVLNTPCFTDLLVLLRTIYRLYVAKRLLRQEEFEFQIPGNLIAAWLGILAGLD